MELDPKGRDPKAIAHGSQPFGWVRRSEREGYPPNYHFTADETTAAKWERQGESPVALFRRAPSPSPAPGVVEGLSASLANVLELARIKWGNLDADANKVFETAERRLVSLAQGGDGGVE